MEMMFIEARFRGHMSEEFIRKIKETIAPYKKVNTVCAVQFVDQMNEFIEKTPEKEFIIKSSKYRARYPGQILGCDVYAADCPDCDATLSFTQGMFHVLGIPIKYGKSVINADPESETIEIVDKELAEKYRTKSLQGVGIALTSKNVMFIESTKVGQIYGVKLLKEALAKRGAKIYSVVQDEINYSRLNEFRDIDVFINTACQRIAIDDSEKLDKPIINAEDLESYLLK